MSLLPKAREDFNKTEYWNAFFTSRGQKSFEWYGEYLELCAYLHRYIRPIDKVLVAGCGNSSLSANLYDAGLKDLINVDISAVVIKQMKRKHEKQRPLMQWLVSDLSKTCFSDGEFGVVMDKGTLDAIMADDSVRSLQLADSIFAEFDRVLKVGGRYVCVSLMQEHIMRHLYKSFSNRGWLLRIHVYQREYDSSSSSINFPVFIVVCTKLKKMVGINPVTEFIIGENKPIKLASLDELASQITGLQQVAFVQNKLAKSLLDEEIFIDLHDGRNEFPKYRLYVVDSPENGGKLKYSVFIVPQGRETEWIFGSPEGRFQLAATASSQRLVVVHLNRNCDFTTIDDVKAELGSYVLPLTPPNTPSNYKVPYLSIGDDIGERTNVYKGESEMSGSYVVEDVKTEDGLSRRLVFLNNPNVIQSEANLTETGKVDFKTLCCAHHRAMAASVDLHTKRAGKKMFRILIVGLGGGSLPMYIYHSFKQVNVDVVELDASILEIARTWFGFRDGKRMCSVVDDGLSVIDRAQKETYDIIMIDADNKSVVEGMSCPPPGFVDEDFLRTTKEALTSDGMLVLNLVCRDASLKSDVLTRISGVFLDVKTFKIDEEVNEIVFASRDVVDWDAASIK